MNARKSDNPQGWLSDQLEQIRGDGDLSADGKIRRIARAYTTAKTNADQQRKDHADTWLAERDRTHNSSPPGTSTSAAAQVTAAGGATPTTTSPPAVAEPA